MKVHAPRFRINDFVWAKVVGYAYWPAIIMEPDPLALPNKPLGAFHYWVYFFGSHNYAWIPKKYLRPFEKHIKEFTKKCSQSVKRAYKELLSNKTQLDEDPDFEINFIKFNPKEEKARPRSARSRKSSTSSYGSRGRRRKDSGRPSSISTGQSRSPMSDYTFETINEASDDFKHIPKDAKTLTKEVVGVFACNLYADAFTKNLVAHGHNVLVWSPSAGLCSELAQLAKQTGTHFKEYKSLRELAKRANIIFSCFTSPDEAKAILYELGADDKLDNLLWGKIYVEMTTIDYETSYNIENFLHKKRASYVEVMIQGTHKEVEDRENILLVGGRVDKVPDVLIKYNSCFTAFGKATCVVGQIGAATKVHAMIQTMKALFLAGFAEALALADKYIDLDVFLDIFEATELNCGYFQRVCETIRKKKYFDIQETLQALQQDVAEFLVISQNLRQGAPMAATANQLYKHARLLGYDDRDSSCMFLLAK